MKKVLVQLLVLSLILSLTACSRKNPSQTGPSNTVQNPSVDQTQKTADYSAWPEKDITIITNGKAGSSNDMLARTLAQVLDGKLNGHKIIVENIVDPTGYSAWKTVQEAEPDGYCLTVLAPTVVSANLTGGSTIDYQDFTYLSAFYIDPQVVYCRTEEPYNTFAEMMEYAKENPGTVTAGTSSATNDDNVLVQKLRLELGYDIGCVTYSGGSEVTTSVLGGFVNFGIGEYMDIQPNVEIGDLKVLGTFVRERTEMMPDLPTVKEQGFDITMERTRGVAGPLGMEKALVERINEVLKSAYDTEAFQTFITQQGSEPNYITSDVYRQFYDAYCEAIKGTLDIIMQ